MRPHFGHSGKIYLRLKADAFVSVSQSQLCWVFRNSKLRQPSTLVDTLDRQPL